jgi:hypothetical protein
MVTQTGWKLGSLLFMAAMRGERTLQLEVADNAKYFNPCQSFLFFLGRLWGDGHDQEVSGGDWTYHA